MPAPHVFVAQVSPMDRHGYVHLSCDLIMTLEHVYRADKIIFEVNARAPMVWGESACRSLWRMWCMRWMSIF